MNEPYITATAAGRVLTLSPAMVRQLAIRGRLRVAATTETGTRLYDRADVEALRVKRAARTGRPA